MTVPVNDANWSVADLARYIGVSEKGVFICVRQGLIPHVVRDGEIHFSETVIRNWQLGRDGRYRSSEPMSPKEVLLRWTGAWAGEPPFLLRDLEEGADDELDEPVIREGPNGG